MKIYIVSLLHRATIKNVVVKKFTFTTLSPDEFLVYNSEAIPIFIPAPIFGTERVTYHQSSSLVSTVKKISVMICILNTLSLFQDIDFIYLRL